MNNKIEHIICSAIDFNGIIVCGRRHKDCHRILSALKPNLRAEDEPTRKDQGFMTSTGRYVSRAEAYHIALNADQLLIGPNDMQILTSEDLYGTEPEE